MRCCMPKHYVLEQDEVHVWHGRMESAHVLRLTQVLAPDEWRKAQQFHSPRDRRCHIIGRGILRFLIGHLLAIRPEAVRFRCNRFGKPYVSNAQNTRGVDFSVSHSADLLLIALTTNRQIGLDVERVRADLDVDCIVRSFFSASEIAEFAAMPSIAKNEAFFRGWCRKEAS